MTIIFVACVLIVGALMAHDILTGKHDK